jgi:hypothetical protein
MYFDEGLVPKYKITYLYSIFLSLMCLGFRRPSIHKRIAARTSLKRIIKTSLGLKAPRGCGWLTNPRQYRRILERRIYKLLDNVPKQISNVQPLLDLLKQVSDFGKYYGVRE